MNSKSPSSPKPKKQHFYLWTALLSLPPSLLVEWLWPNVIPFTFFEFWRLPGSLIEALKASWLIFAWGIGFTLLISLLTFNSRKENSNAEILFLVGGAFSLFAGVFEEISFRWLIFFNSIIGMKILDFFFFGWLGFGVVNWLFNALLAPIANFFTLGLLSPVLINGSDWAVGMGFISSNGKFRNAHANKGWVGYLNSWFLGMLFFYLLFNYGLLACMLVHFLHDLFIKIIRYIDRIVKRSLGLGTPKRVSLRYR